MEHKTIATGVIAVCMMVMTVGLASTTASAWSLPIPASVDFTGYDLWATGQPAGTQWFAADGDTGLCQLDRSSIYNPTTHLYFNLYPLSVAANGYNYQSDCLIKKSTTGWFEARFHIPDLEPDAYGWYKLKLFLNYFRSPDFPISQQTAYYFGVTTTSSQSLLSDILFAYAASSGYNEYAFWSNYSPDTGLPWTKEEIGDLQLRVIVHSGTVTATELKVIRFYGLAIPTTAPNIEPADIVLRPNGDYYIDPDWECYPSNDTYWDKVDDTVLFGDWWATQVMTEHDVSLTFDFTDIPPYWDETTRFSLSIWVIAWVDYEFELQYPYISFGPVGGYGLPAVWSDHYVVSSVRSNFTCDWLLNPDTGYAWSVPELNDLRVMINTEDHQGGYMNITQVGIVLTLVEGLGPIIPSEDKGWDYSLHDIRLWMTDGGVGWIFLLLGGVLMIGTPIMAVIAAQEDGYVEGMSKFLIMGLLGLGFVLVGLM
jgi:hypothetical protein